ncbi:MAG: GpE family phage tail protein [Chromatiales bacterium]|nr:GpE family phage tail protein [Gammaproteobacteria bacterium]
MANIALVFHWQPSEMKTMAVEELLEYHRLALERARVTRG